MRIFFKLICFLFLTLTSNAQQLAFPSAEGGGKYAKGGRGGTVYEVTNLNDSGSGSLRDAVSQGDRTVVFKVSGFIKLKSRLAIRKDNITIAGQTAPGDGICVGGYSFNISANNIVIRFMRFRLGDEFKVEDDAINCFSGDYKNIIIDHCSMSWSIDEVASFYSIKNFTLQWCIVSESLYDSYHSKGKHGYGGIWGGENASYHHNLIANHTSRTPRFNGTRYNSQIYADSVEFNNNVIYNWGSTNSIYGGEGGSYNMINNYFKAGSATPGNLTSSGSSNKRHRILNYTSFYIDGKDSIFGGRFYIDGNYTHGYPDVTADNWTRGVQKDSYSGAYDLISKNRKNSPYLISDYQSESAEQAYENVIISAGAILPKRDTIDSRIISELVIGKSTFEGNGYKSVTSTGITRPAGIIDTPNDVGGYPDYISTTPPLDSDHDGMADTWEISNGLDPNNANDRNQINGDGYSKLEEYLEYLTRSISTKVNDVDKSIFDFSFFPNPASNFLIIHSTRIKDLTSIQLYDINGQVLINQKDITLEGNQFKLDLNHVASGTYLLQVNSKNKSFGHIVIKN